MIPHILRKRRVSLLNETYYASPGDVSEETLCHIPGKRTAVPGCVRECVLQDDVSM